MPAPTPHTWKVTIVMADGSRGRHFGVYANGHAAIDRAMDLFPTARSISARRLVPKQPGFINHERRA